MKRLLAAGIGIVAAVVGWWVVVRDTGPEVVDGPRSVVVLDADDSAETIIPVYEPADMSQISVRDLATTTFRWGSVPGVQRYSVVINNEVGIQLWRANPVDTVLTLPEKVVASVLPGGQLKWIVGGMGASASSDIYRIELTR